MDIEHLNKTQIVMLALLVSFVSSIATGIVTVSLVSQAPAGVTQTINRIVERTVEKVVTEPSKAIAAVAVSAGVSPQPTASVEKTVVVKEDDLAANSISTIQKSIVKIVEKGAPESAFYARGIIVTKEGVIVSDRSSIDPNLGSEAIFPNGERFPVTARASGAGTSIMVLDPSFVGTSTPDFTPAPLTDISKIRLGQAVIRIGGKGRDAVSTGVVSSLPDTSENADNLIETNVAATVPGSVLITIFGEVVGMTTGDSLASGNGFYTSAKAITQALSAKAK